MDISVPTKNDTICAISSPHGIGGIAVIRISGPNSIPIVERIWKGKKLDTLPSHTLHFGTITDTDSTPLDQCVLSLFRAPGSFTGEDVIELSVHGSKWVQRRLIEALIENGCRIAGPGEFTRRAFLSGKIDLAEAEAIADVIASDSRAAHRIAMNHLRGGFSERLLKLKNEIIELSSLLELELDFSEEDVEFASRDRLKKIAHKIDQEISRLRTSYIAGNAIKEGIPVAITGATNAGKSSLLNAILGDDRAIVSDIHGTTRDTIEELITLGDYQFRFIDTAGLRQTTDRIESIGIKRSIQAISRSRIVIAVIDSTRPLDTEILRQAASVLDKTETPGYLIVALNKTDLIEHGATDALKEKIKTFLSGFDIPGHIWQTDISAKSGLGIDRLCGLLTKAAETDNGNADEGILVTNARHAAALTQASTSIKRVIYGLDDNISGDFIAQDLRETISHLSEITGDIPSSEILATIFSRFCIGK